MVNPGSKIYSNPMTHPQHYTLLNDQSDPLNEFSFETQQFPGDKATGVAKGLFGGDLNDADGTISIQVQ